MTRYKVGLDSATAVQRLTGRRWGRSALLFAERILYRPAVSEGGKKRSLENPFKVGWYVGHHSRTGTLIVLSPAGAVKAKTFKRLPED